MTNTYAINTVRRREFAVEQDLIDMGVKPWLPRRLCNKTVSESPKPIWYEAPYVSKLIFCVFPAVYFRDVCELKYVIGKPYPLSERDIKGQRAYTTPKGTYSPEVPGLETFKEAVEAEYVDMEAKRANSEWVCEYEPGQALEMLTGPLEGFQAKFCDTVREARNDFARLRVEVEAFGRVTVLDVPPGMVSSA